MEKKRKQHYRLGDGQQEQNSAETLDKPDSQGKEEVVPGVSIIRTSTPRPFSFDMMSSYSGYFRSLQPGGASAFPEQAPSAPPLPEELGEHELNIGVAASPTSYINNISPNVLSQDQVIQQDTPSISKVTESFPTIPSTQIPPSILPGTSLGSRPSKIQPQQDEQNTDPLPTVKKGPYIGDAIGHKSLAPLQTNWALVIFSVYLAVLLVIVLVFAVLQGMGFGQDVLTNDFSPLEVPWLVIMYGLLGGCISSLLSLGHLRVPHPPLFVIITWFARPYIGAVLAIFAYVLLTSGVFLVGQNVEKHLTFFWLVGALAGFSEGRLFFRRG